MAPRLTPFRSRAVAATLVVLALAAVAVLAVPSLRARVFGVPLRMTWQVGHRNTFRTVVEGKIRLDVGGVAALALPPAAQRLANQDVPFQVVTRSLQEVMSVGPDGVATVAVTPQGGTYRITLMGMERQGRIPPGTASKVQMDARGRLVGGGSASAPNPQERLAGEAMAAFDAGLLPGGTKRPGAIWEEPVNVPLDVKGFHIQMRGRVAHRFTGVAFVNGRPAADLESRAEVAVEVVPQATATSFAGMVLNGSVTLDSMSFFDWGESRMESSRGTGRLDMNLAAKLPVLGSLATGTRMTASFTLKTERIP